MKETAIAWAAGLFEGEGSIFLTKIRGYSYVRMNLKMTDLDVLEKFKRIVGCGKLYTAKSRRQVEKKHKQAYYWQLCNKEEINKLCNLFLPHLCARRTSKIKELLG